LAEPLAVSIDAARRLQLEKQGIGELPKRATRGRVEETVSRLGCVQIDTINVVERAHYLTIWTRLGRYRKDDLHSLAYSDRRLFEGWGHAMCYMPTSDWRYTIRANRERAKTRVIHTGWFSRVDDGLVEAVLDRIKKEGPLGSADFEGKKSSSGWWGWKPAKRALEALFSAGELMVARRDGFQRIYDLTERVLPSWVDASEPTEEERQRFFIMRTLGCLGVTKPSDIRRYYHFWCVKLDMSVKQIQATLDSLVEEGVATRVKLEGLKQPYYCLAEDTTRLEELEHGWGYNGVRFATYFDSLLWHSDRLESLFGFKRTLEVYLKPEERKYGYFTLPVIYADRIIGRFDPKLDRKNKTLILRGLWHEEGFRPDEVYEDEFERTLADFAAFNGAEKIDRRY